MAAGRALSVILCLVVTLLSLQIQAWQPTPPPASQPAVPGPAAQPRPPPSTAKNGVAGGGSLRPEECSGRCSARCSATQYKKACLFFCRKCCAVCLCVPPGTYGNKQLCPCYDNWKTKRGGPKCP